MKVAQAQGGLLVVADASRRRPSIALFVRLAVAAVLVLATAAAIAAYPLEPWIIGAPLLIYAAVLWWRPVSFLVVLPCVLPVWDLGIWTGWSMVNEADLFVLTTLAVLLIRAPPRVGDLYPRGWPRYVLLSFAAIWAIAVVVGLSSPLGAPQSDNAFLRPDNALRIAKSFVEALLLLPFLRQREREHGDGISRLGWGVSAGIGAVALVILAERALFPGLWDFSGDYRVTGPFTSMQVGGGHIGAYIALALPMTLCLPRLRPRRLAMGLLLLTCLLGGYTLTVTFARTGYAAGAGGMAVAGAGWMWASRRQDQPAALGLLPVMLVIAILIFAAALSGMRERFADTARDYVTREDNWRAGLAVRDTGVIPTVFGMGLGTYQRAMEMRSAVNRPSDLAVRADRQGPYLAMRVEAAFFLGQKVAIPAVSPLYLTLQARSSDNDTSLGVLLCDKVLLYSDNCRGGNVAIFRPDIWQAVSVTLPTAGLGAGFGWLRRPVELSLAGGPAGHHIDIRDIHLTDARGHDVVNNGDFGHGLERWVFTDDNHISWRMKDLYLMLWFQTGILGVLAFLALSGLALAGGIRAAWRGAVTGAAVAGSIAGFLMSGLFDDVIEPPRLAALFFLICFCGLIQWEERRLRPRLQRPPQP